GWAGGARQEGERSGRERVAPLDGRLDQPTALFGRQARIRLHAGRFGGEPLVLDRVPEPARVVVASEMMRPRLVVDAGGELNEDDEVLSAELELSGGAAEVEAPVLTELARGVLADVAALR